MALRPSGAVKNWPAGGGLASMSLSPLMVASGAARAGEAAAASHWDRFSGSSKAKSSSLSRRRPEVERNGIGDSEKEEKVTKEETEEKTSTTHPLALLQWTGVRCRDSSWLPSGSGSLDTPYKDRWRHSADGSLPALRQTQGETREIALSAQTAALSHKTIPVIHAFSKIKTFSQLKVNVLYGNLIREEREKVRAKWQVVIFHKSKAFPIPAQ